MSTPRAPEPGPWVRTIDWTHATGRLKEAYDWQAAALGEPAEFTRLGSLAPEVAHARLVLYRAVEGVQSSLTPTERLVAAYVTSRLNGTPHCSSGLEVKLADIGVAPELVRAAATRPSTLASGDPRLDAIAEHAALLTTRPDAVTVDDIERLRAVGLDDTDVVDLNNLVAYYCYINRVANGLGLRTTIPPDHARRAVPA